MAVIVRDKLLFLANPRTGSTATRDALLGIPGSRSVGDHHARYHDIYSGDKPKGLITVTTVRNHYDAIASWFCLNPQWTDMITFLKGYKHTYFARGKELWWLHTCCDHYLRYESLESELNELLTYYDLPEVVLPRVNVTEGKVTYYNTLSSNFIWDRFGMEMVKYGYLPFVV